MNWTLPDGTVFAGNAPVKQQLSSALSPSAFPHALLIEGPVGSGRRTVARLIAAAAVCQAEGERPCGRCAACRKAASGNHPDIREYGGDGDARSFHIETVRLMREEVYILPNEAVRSVSILCDVQNMTEQAQNSLLKLLEEPPAHAVFVLTCDVRSHLLDTVLSRVFPVTLTGVSVPEAVTVLHAHLPDRPEAELIRAATLFNGVIGQALKGLENGSYQEILTLLPALAKGITAPTEWDLLCATAPLAKNKDAVPAVLNGLRLLFRDALVQRFESDSLLGTDAEAAETLARSLTQKQLLALLTIIEDLTAARLYNMNQTLFLTVFCSRLRRAAGH